MENKDFVHLHNHSEYSSFDGQAKLYDLVMHARSMGFPAFALTDHGNVGGLVKFLRYCYDKKDKKGKPISFNPIKAIPGAELYMSKDRFAQGNIAQPEGRKGNYHIILIAKNYIGYQNLCKLSSRGFTEGLYSDPRIDFSLLDECKEGLICSSACLKGLINMNLLHDRYDEARAAAGVFRDIFGKDFFLEVMYHGIKEERMILGDIVKLSHDLGIPLIATNDCHYITKKMAKSQEVFMCISVGGGKCINDPKRIKFDYDEFYLKSAAEMYKIFGKIDGALHNTVEVANRVDDKDILNNLFSSKMRLPEFKLPEKFSSPDEYLSYLAWEGMRKIGWDKSQDHVDALKKELEDIRIAKVNNGYDFATYFLIEWDIINFARKNSILTGCGRGSGYSSILLRCLGVTYGVDPIENGLLWERFLGFSESLYIDDSDFTVEGDDEEICATNSEPVSENIFNDDDDIDESRDLEDDLGGVDRY